MAVATEACNASCFGQEGVPSVAAWINDGTEEAVAREGSSSTFQCFNVLTKARFDEALVAMISA